MIYLKIPWATDKLYILKYEISILTAFLYPQVVYKNNDVRLELSRLAKQGDPKMKIHGVVAFKCENVATLDPITFETPESFISLPKWNAKKTGSISFDFRTTEPNGLILFSHGKPRHQKDAKHPQMIKVDFFAIEMLDGHLYLLLDMGSGTIKIKALQKKVNDGEWYHVDFQRDGRSGNLTFYSAIANSLPPLPFWIIATKSY